MLVRVCVVSVVRVLSVVSLLLLLIRSRIMMLLLLMMLLDVVDMTGYYCWCWRMCFVASMVLPIAWLQLVYSCVDVHVYI